MSRLLTLWREAVSAYRKPMQVFGVVLALMMLIDFFARVYVSRDASLRTFTAPTIQKTPQRVTATAALAQIESWLPVKQEVEPPKERDISLQGIFSSKAGGVAAVVLRDPNSGSSESLRVAEGQIVEGWTIERIGPRKVTLRRGEQSRELLLFRPPTE